MPQVDSTAKAQLEKQVVVPAYYVFIDIDGDPIRVTTHVAARTFSGTGDSDLDGTYQPIGPVLDFGDVNYQEGGSDTLVIEMSGIATIDTDLLSDIGNNAKWRGRLCRIWMQAHDEAGTAQGAIIPYYTGYMSSVGISPSPETQTIRLSVENYLAAWSHASNRSYLNQKDYDASDNSAAATLAAMNLARPAGQASGAGGGGGWNDSGGGGRVRRTRSISTYEAARLGIAAD